MNDNPGGKTCAGLILAAGRSERMGTPKPDLSWGNTTVLGEVINQLARGGLSKLFIVVNPLRMPNKPETGKDVELSWIVNEKAERGEMLVSIQTGLKSLPEDVEYAFISLGDQPTIQSDVVGKLISSIDFENDKLVFPSYRYHRGHPWIVNRKYWPEICEMQETDTVRTFINRYGQQIKYVDFDFDPPEDMDTPDVYVALKKKFGK